MQTLEKKLEKKKELEKLYPYDPERQFFELWRFNDPKIPKDVKLKTFKKWCREGSHGLYPKPWKEYLKEIGAYYLSEDLIVQAMKDYHEEHGKHPVQKSGDASKYIGFKITWVAINACLRQGNRGLPSGSSLAQLRQKYFTGIEPDSLTENLIVKAMKAYFEEHGKYPVQKSGDASKYIGFKITWEAINACLERGNRGLPGGSSLAQLKQESLTGKETPLTEDLIVKAMEAYFEEHAKYPTQLSGDASKYFGFKITWLAINGCLYKGLRGLPGGSSLAQLKKDHHLGETPLTEDLIVKAMKAYFEEHGKYPSLKSGDASKYIGFKITWVAVHQCLRLGLRGLPGGSSLAKLKKKIQS